jgi:hypothetical protein
MADFIASAETTAARQMSQPTIFRAGQIAGAPDAFSAFIDPYYGASPHSANRTLGTIAETDTSGLRGKSQRRS